MKTLNLLIKPASSKCNINCKYCFYHDSAKNRETKDYGIMTHEVLETLVKRAFENESEVINFSFQGGEPTLAKIDYFYKMHELIEKYNNKKISTQFSLQTNGILINDEWSKLFKEYDYLIGLSLDGHEKLHNSNRQKKEGEATFIEVMRGVEYFRKHEVTFNILTVVTKDTTFNIDEMMTFFESENLKYLQFIPCLDPLKLENKKNDLNDYYLNNDLYFNFLTKAFEYYKNYFLEKNYVSMRYFDNLMNIFSGKYPEACGMLGQCSIQNIIEADGSLYVCDFYVLDEYKLGNIKTSSFNEMKLNPVAKSFIEDSTITPTKCKACKYINVCYKGGCKRYRVFSEKKKYYINKFCKAYYQFFEAHYNDLVMLSKKVKEGYLLK